MRSFPLAALLCLPLSAQTAGMSRNFLEGAVSSRLTLNLPAAIEAGDRIEIDCSTRRLHVTLITPDGRRITSDNASTARLDWSESPSSEADWGKSVIITFRSPAQSGTFTVDVGGQTVRASKVSVSLFSPSKTHLRVLEKVFPGAIVAASVHPPETITLAVKEDEKASLIDALVSELTARIVLTLPDGQIVTPESAPSQGLEWITTDDPSTQRTQVAGLLFPQPGRHHLIYFKRVAHGSYRIAALDPGRPVEFRALFLPYESGWDRYLQELSSRIPEAGKVSMRAWNPRRDCFVGESLDISISLEGDTVQDPPTIAAYYDSPTRPAHLSFVQRDDGRYHAAFVPNQPGLLHLTFRAKGKTTSGVAFSDELQLPEVIVKSRATPSRAVGGGSGTPVTAAPGQTPHLPSQLKPGCPVSLVSASRPSETKREGRVALTARIDDQGRAHDVKVIRSVNADLDREAIQYVEQCGRYAPQPGQISIDVQFRSL